MFEVVFVCIGGYISEVRRGLIYLATAFSLAVTISARGASGSTLKVLPEFLDKQGRNSLVPSLYERDAYQVRLRQHPELRSGMRFYIEWKIKGGAWEPLKVRVELRGVTEGDLPKQLVLEESLENTGGWFSHWTGVTVSSEAYKKLGAVTAWRVTLWEGRRLLSEQKSFLW